MNSALATALLLLLGSLGAALSQTWQHWCTLLVVLGLGLGVLRRCCGLSRPSLGLISLLLALVIARSGLAAEPRPHPLDPSHWIPVKGPAVEVTLQGRLLNDGRLRDGRCRALLEVNHLDGARRRGRTELTVDPCQQPLHRGDWLEVTGALRRPRPAAHPLLRGGAERLLARGSWSQIRSASVQVLRQSWTPLADGRRRIAEAFTTAAGPARGGLLAALVLGSAQVDLMADLREAFRVAGLSHALAASGFHLSVLLGTTLAATRSGPSALHVGAGGSAMGLFLALAGAQPSVVRAVLMGAAALLIREGGQRSRPLGVLVLTLLLMLLMHPAWARSVGFQLSAAATAGLVVSAAPLEQWLCTHGPGWLRPLAPALSVPIAALAWTLPLQLLHFGSTPLYALVSNLLAAPLLAPLTLSAMALALLVLVAPAPITAFVLPWLIWPVQQLAGVLIVLVHWISGWPWAQLLTGRPQPLVVLALALALIPWWLPALRRWRCHAVPLALLAVVVQGWVQCSDDLIRVEQWGRQWLVLRHRGRAALLSSHGDGLSCHVARQLGAGLGHARFDWVAVMDPVAMDQSGCWTPLAHTVLAEQQGQLPLRSGQTLTSAGLGLRVTGARGRHLQVQVGQRLFALRRRDLLPPRGELAWVGRGAEL
ncbi:MAG: ComEC/Rec2 family competence protein [Synechococcus sp.]|uniref:ComEC/Rec2 family competence protein n=1 Tax=Synechococcus sp. BMK-MC-1 TaxID=1442551 RepID=UPI001648014C|nr:ComEC/Rec2 family competence protein [Synechococcus sp. BMK-MC-1]QNI68170.1 competence protein ComEC [Synechococcus sp. BMK-MC-1]